MPLVDFGLPDGSEGAGEEDEKLPDLGKLFTPLGRAKVTEEDQAQAARELDLTSIGVPGIWWKGDKDPLTVAREEKNRWRNRASQIAAERVAQVMVTSRSMVEGKQITCSVCGKSGGAMGDSGRHLLGCPKRGRGRPRKGGSA